jgi:hypothetical protein
LSLALTSLVGRGSITGNGLIGLRGMDTIKNWALGRPKKAWAIEQLASEGFQESKRKADREYEQESESSAGWE